jgi:hypothetical protein
MSDDRTDAEIRAEIAVEREGLASALTDLRRAVNAKRSQGAAVGAALMAGLAGIAAVRIVRRLRRD